MPHIPKGFCLECKKELIIKKNGVLLEVRTNKDKPYYLIDSDTWECPDCEIELSLGLAQQPYSNNYDDDFEDRRKDVEGIVYLK